MKCANISNAKQNCAETIDINLLFQYGGYLKSYGKGEHVFREGEHPRYYYQVKEGRVKTVSDNDNGRDFIQGFFSSGQSFGEMPVFESDSYPASAIAEQPSIIIRLCISSFMQLLKENFEVHLNITKLISQGLKNKTNKLKQVLCCSPEQRILNFLNDVKSEKLKENNDAVQQIKIDLTRQQIADMNGLRVETVIRAMRSLYSRKLLTIEHGRVFY